MIDKKAEKWAEKNKWFGKNKSLTNAAIYFHGRLVNMNVNPTSKKYYDLIDLIMEPYVSKKIIFKSRPKKKKMEELTPSQIDIAKKLKVPIKLLKLHYESNKVEWK